MKGRVPELMTVFIYIHIQNYFLILDLLFCLCPFLSHVRAGWHVRNSELTLRILRRLFSSSNFFCKTLRVLGRVVKTFCRSYIDPTLDLAAISASSNMAILLAKKLEIEARGPSSAAIERHGRGNAEQAPRTLIMQTMLV